MCILGLLIARSIVPNKEKLAHHWRTTDEGAIPRGCFGLFIACDRCLHLSRNLHFSRNNDDRTTTDRAWKLRPVIDTLQDRFSDGFVPPAVMAFAEAMLPSRFSFNRMRVYVKDKPHKWGTKLFMLCCSRTAYCIRLEVYCGKKERAGGISSIDYKSGPAAVVRNLREVFGPTPPANGSMRLVVTDRFYSAVPLSMQLLTIGFYSIGTVRTDRQGLSAKLIPKMKGDKTNSPKIPKNRPVNIERGAFTVAEALRIPGMKVMRWWDTRSVHMLSTSGSVEVDSIVRRDILTGEQQEVTCPRIVKDYQTYMGGVGVYDQLRLQRKVLTAAVYQIQEVLQALLFGLVDLVIINAFIIYNSRRAMVNLSKLSHVTVLKHLQLELCQLREEDWVTLQNKACLQVTPSKRLQRANGRQAAHQPMQNDEWRSGNNQQGRKRRTRVCKVCSLLKGTDNARGGDSSIYCSECKLPNTSKNPMAWRVFLCEKMRHTYNRAAMSCFDIWHKAWRNGMLLPKKAGKRNIRARTPARHENENEEKDEGERVPSSSDKPMVVSPNLPKRARLAPDTAMTD